jgi:hypothetical protein
MGVYATPNFLSLDIDRFDTAKAHFRSHFTTSQLKVSY